ncbi:uncharacterized protein J7T54_008477 [Emericellopsis cladophorae]|uniref:FAD-binding domain-containing protein n=1 Tax=Emericellopsis cladophorae TaxID=2686198 RepID=A0A9P9XUZ7_9HYPO|nr:uncharacterized protein J7T54_008477 [Emericellopsis cladophorae]KAI6778299.1 hypothetical protein J7T54_008477 [Emericellopsis cladophorae]
MDKPVLIIGAGVCGLTLAQALQRSGIPFEVFERDEHVSSRGQGWAITLHWALPYLKKMFSEQTMTDIDSVQVDPDADRDGQGKFVFINLKTLEPRFRIPPSQRRRVSREKLRRVLLHGVSHKVNWNKSLSSISQTPDGVVATFEDGSQFEGSIVVGADGTNSKTRKILVPDNHKNIRLPVKFVGSAVKMTSSQVQPLRAVDPLLFQGCHPETKDFLWVSMLDTPGVNGTKDTEEELYQVQINLSWLTHPGDDDTKLSDAARLADMKRRAQRFHPVLRDAVQSIPEESQVLEIVLQDWPCYDWNNRGGRVTLIGDAAHAMTMYRGEAANHGMLDACRLWETLEGVYSREVDLRKEIDGFEAEMRERTQAAVLLSRQACYDAHDWAGLNENSAVLKKRAIYEART